MSFQNPTPQTTSLAHIANGGRPGFLTRVGDAFEAFSSALFGPGTPPAPSAASQLEGVRSRQYRPGVNLSYTPRSSENLTPFSSLIALAENYDIARICIAYWCEQIASLDWEVVPAKKGATVPESELDRARALLEKPDGVHSFAEWITAATDEVLTTDALSIYPRRDRVGRLLWFELVDGSTIAPKTDALGNVPAPPGIGYQQVLYGVPWWEGTRDELLYRPKNRRTRSQYGRAPTEDLLLTINRAIRRQTFDLTDFTSGNTPEALVTAPKDMSPDGIKDFQLWWDEMMTTPALRAGLRFVPGGDGFTVHEFKEHLKDAVMEEWLATITAARYGVPPQEIGLTADVNKSTSDGQENVQFRRRQPYLRYFAAIFTTMLQMWGCEGMRLQFSGQIPEEDKLAQAEVDKIYVQIGVTHPDEIRARMGITEKLGTVPAVYTASGPVPVLTQAVLDQQEADKAAGQAQAQALIDAAGSSEADDDAAEEDGGAPDGSDADGDPDDDAHEDVERVIREVRAHERYARGGKRRPFEWAVAPEWVRRLSPIIGDRQTVEVVRARDAARLEDDGEDDTVPSHRDEDANAFALVLAGLLGLLQRGQISEAQYAAFYAQAWADGIAATLASVAAATGADVRALGSEIAGQVSTLTAQASTSAAGLGADIAHRLTQPSEAMRTAQAVRVAGGLWAVGMIATGAGHRLANPLSTVIGTWEASDDDRVSDDCDDLNGQEWPFDEIPQFPGDGATDCGGMCRCEITYRLEDVFDVSEADTEADVDESA